MVSVVEKAKAEGRESGGSIERFAHTWVVREPSGLKARVWQVKVKPIRNFLWISWPLDHNLQS